MTFLVQETSGSTTGTSLTLTLPANATPGNGLILAVVVGGTVSGITIGGTGSLFTLTPASTGSTGSNVQIWYCPTGSVSSASIVITTAAGGIIGYAYEVPGTLTVDAGGWNTGTGTSWSSGATGTSLPIVEFVVGIGGTIGTSSTTIAGPGGSWANELAYNGVLAAGEYYGGISGYQTQNAYTGAAYTYSGTVSASTNWGAAVATFACMTTATGYGGYQFSEHSAYTGISATFTIPFLSGESGALCSIWVGLGGGNYDAIYQTGIYASYNTGYSGNNMTTPWSFWLPGAGELWDTTAYPTAAADSLTCTVQLTSTDWLMTLTNHTQNWTYTEVKSVLAINIGSVQNNGAGPTAWAYPNETAWVIIEKEGSDPNPDYGSIAFTSVTTTPAIVNAPNGFLTVNTAIDQYPGQFNTGNGSFTMYWNGYA